eukprot:scaffold323_cov414-Prasinococcus_capsulatus_cf.AAC.40
MPPGSMRPTCRACSSHHSASKVLQFLGTWPALSGVLMPSKAYTLPALDVRAPTTNPVSKLRRSLNSCATRAGRPHSSTTSSGIARKLQRGAPSRSRGVPAQSGCPPAVQPAGSTLRQPAPGAGPLIPRALSSRAPSSTSSSCPCRPGASPTAAEVLRAGAAAQRIPLPRRGMGMHRRVLSGARPSRQARIAATDPSATRPFVTDEDSTRASTTLLADREHHPHHDDEGGTAGRGRTLGIYRKRNRPPHAMTEQATRRGSGVDGESRDHARAPTT